MMALTDGLSLFRWWNTLELTLGRHLTAVLWEVRDRIVSDSLPEMQVRNL